MGTDEMSDPAVTFVETLVADHPELEPLLAEHRDDNFGDVLPHVFFGELTQWVVDQHLDNAADSSALDPLLAHLEAGLLDGDDEVKELIAVSFVENLPYPDDDGADIIDRLGPTLTAELETQRPE
jgi:hypothetical protein